jgi:transcription antitermination factor NusG
MTQADSVARIAELPLVELPGEGCGDWHVLHTRSRQEKAVAADLLAMGVGYFLPLVRQPRYYGRRKMSVDLPMFPGYVFMRGSLDQAYQIDRTGRVAQIIRVVNQKQLGWELSNLHLALARHAPMVPYPHLKVGRKVEIKSGPLRGLQGIVEECGGQKLWLQVEMLGRGVSLEVEGALLEAMD